MSPYIAYLHEETARLQQEQVQLAESGRVDEANLVKIQINIYGVCQTVYDATKKAVTTDSFERVYLQKLRTLHDTWQLAYEKAKAHEDVEKLLVEEVKLKCIEKIKLKFVGLRRGRHVGSGCN